MARLERFLEFASRTREDLADQFVNEVWNQKEVKQDWFAESQKNDQWLASRDPLKFENKLPFKIEDPAWHFPRKVETKLKLGDADFEDLSGPAIQRLDNAAELPPSNPFDGVSPGPRRSRAEEAGISPHALPVAALLKSEQKPPAKRGGQVASAPTPIGAATPAASRSAVRSALSAAGGAPPVELPTPLRRQIQVFRRGTPAAAAPLPASPAENQIVPYQGLAEVASKHVGREIKSVLQLQDSEKPTETQWAASKELGAIVAFVADVVDKTSQRAPTAKQIAKQVEAVLSPAGHLAKNLAKAVRQTATDVLNAKVPTPRAKPKTPKIGSALKFAGRQSVQPAATSSLLPSPGQWAAAAGGSSHEGLIELEGHPGIFRHATSNTHFYTLNQGKKVRVKKPQGL
jgi:hypothetical protein